MKRRSRSIWLLKRTVQVASWLGVVGFFTPWGASGSALAAPMEVTQQQLKVAMEGHHGTIVVINLATKDTVRWNPELATMLFAPCSTFKIWNTLIGLETGEILRADQDFYKWDGVKRRLPAWNQDLTLREAFRFSCVPAFQALARRIGPERMRVWIDKIGYGNKDLSSGQDVFWLPGDGRRSLLISADEQANLMARLAVGEVPFSSHSLAVLKDIMTVLESDAGVLYGKTGTATNAEDDYIYGWFVGYFETSDRVYGFACLLDEKGSSGLDARTIVEKLFFQNR